MKGQGPEVVPKGHDQGQEVVDARGQMITIPHPEGGVRGHLIRGLDHVIVRGLVIEGEDNKTFSKQTHYYMYLSIDISFLHFCDFNLFFFS